MDITWTIRATPDIQRFQPATWDEFVGNYRIKKFFMQGVRRFNQDSKSKGKIPKRILPSFLLHGESRSGKTAMVKHFVRSITCKEINEKTLDPCNGSCKACCQKIYRDGLEGLYSVIVYENHGVPIEFHNIDCTKLVSPVELKEKLAEFQYDSQVLKIIYFDEVHRLVPKKMDEMLLKDIEEKDFIWAFSTAMPQNLEEMFLNRLVKFKTELPNNRELGDWLVDRCQKWGINWEPEAIHKLVGKCNNIPGTALQCLALAAYDPEQGITVDLVENGWDVKIGTVG